jgi:small neutral amino acid transporter SnatA (MarC family)
LCLVVDPFGNPPSVLAVLAPLSPPGYRRAILRRTGLAFAVLFGFARAGTLLLGLGETA